jgi:hypothetical protein
MILDPRSGHCGKACGSFCSRGEMGGGGSVGEEVVHGNLLILIDYLQAIQR